jgi:hypothetical protein
MDCGFDAIAWKDGVPWLLQFKTNKKVSQAELERYKRIEEHLRVRCAWVNRINRKGIEFYDTSYDGFYKKKVNTKAEVSSYGIIIGNPVDENGFTKT